MARLTERCCNYRRVATAANCDELSVPEASPYSNRYSEMLRLRALISRRSHLLLVPKTCSKRTANEARCRLRFALASKGGGGRGPGFSLGSCSASTCSRTGC
jgi:hypothetical protein